MLRIRLEGQDPRIGEEMSDVGRISGPLLKANLVREGIDLAFENDLLYLDVLNQRIGIRTDNPSFALSVNGATQTNNLFVQSNTQLGTDSNNTIEFNAEINSNVIPSENNNYSLGSNTNTWNSIFIDSIKIDSSVVESQSSLTLKTGSSGELFLDSDADIINATQSRITQVADPEDDQDAATKNYVDTSVSGIKIRDLADVDSSTLNDGSIFIYDNELDVFISQTLLEKQTINGGHY